MLSSTAEGVSVAAPARPVPGLVLGWYAVVVFVLVTLLAFIDRQIIILVLQDIRTDFALTDTHIGALQGGAMTLFFALAAIPLGRLVDSRNRRNLLLICMIVWGGMTALSGLAQTYWQLFACRVGVGIGEAALYPAVTSLIADFFEPRRRVFANLVFYVGTLIGASVGLTLGGMAIGWVEANAASMPSALADLAAWRVAFLAVAVPTPFLAILLLTVPEPPREQVVRSAAEPTASGMITYIKQHGSVLVPLGFGVACASAAMNNTIAWMPTILIRAFDYSAADTGTQVGTILGVASVCGVALAGLTMKVRRPADVNTGVLRLVQLGLALCIAFLIAIPYLGSAASTLLVFGIGLFGFFIAAGLFTTLIQNLVAGEFRGRAMATIYLVAAVAHTIIAMTVGLLSDHVFKATRGLLDATMLVGIASLAFALFCFTRLHRRLSGA